jgi:hypothetical protein
VFFAVVTVATEEKHEENSVFTGELEHGEDRPG